MRFEVGRGKRRLFVRRPAAWGVRAIPLSDTRAPAGRVVHDHRDPVGWLEIRRPIEPATPNCTPRRSASNSSAPGGRKLDSPRRRRRDRGRLEQPGPAKPDAMRRLIRLWHVLFPTGSIIRGSRRVSKCRLLFRHLLTALASDFGRSRPLANEFFTRCPAENCLRVLR